jgi:hypothetical protein
MGGDRQQSELTAFSSRAEEFCRPSGTCPVWTTITHHWKWWAIIFRPCRDCDQIASIKPTDLQYNSMTVWDDVCDTFAHNAGEQNRKEPSFSDRKFRCGSGRFTSKRRMHREHRSRYIRRYFLRVFKVSGGPTHAFSRFASQSRLWAVPLRSLSDLPLMVSPSSLPVYFVVNFWSFRSRVTENEI